MSTAPMAAAPSLLESGPCAADLLPLLQALADENRLHVVQRLQSGERCVCDLQAELGLGQSLLSHHLSVLRRAGLVRSRREGRWVYYALEVRTLEAVVGALDRMRDSASAAPEPSRACDP